MDLTVFRRQKFLKWGIVLSTFIIMVFVYFHLNTIHHSGLGPLLSGGPETFDNIFMEPLIDKRPPLSPAKLTAEIAKQCPSLPIQYWEKIKNQRYKYFYKNQSCAMYPDIFDLKFNNVHWQTLKTSNGTIHMFGAYLDIRKDSTIGPSIRILSMIDRLAPTVKTHCQIWYENREEPVIVKTVQYNIIWIRAWGNNKQFIFQPYLISCSIPQEFATAVPVAMSLVEKECDFATNNLRVIYNRPEKKEKFAVCVKGLDFSNDLSVRLTEWIEMLGILGASKIFFYQLNVHPNVTKVLKHYEELGKVDVTQLTLAGFLPNQPNFRHRFLKERTIHKRQHELIPYNDCLYKNLYSYEYIILLDTDEVIMPVEDDDWYGLMERILPKSVINQSSRRSSYNVRNVYFLDDLLHTHGWFKDIPKYMHMLQHVYRARNFTKPGHFIKCFHDTNMVMTLHNHFPFSCCCGSCSSYSIETNNAQMQHYRTDCVGDLGKKYCIMFRKEFVMDTTIWKHKNALIARTTDTLKTLGFLL